MDRRIATPLQKIATVSNTLTGMLQRSVARHAIIAALTASAHLATVASVPSAARFSCGKNRDVVYDVVYMVSY